MRIISRIAGISIAAFLGVLGLGSFGISSAEAQTVATATLYYNGDVGSLYYSTRLDRKTSGECRIIIRGNVSYDGVVAQTRKIIEKRFTTRKKNIEFLVSDLEGVVNNEGSGVPVLTLQSKITCKKNGLSLVSNAVARYINCGVTGEDQTAADFLNGLNAKTKEALSSLQ